MKRLHKLVVILLVFSLFMTGDSCALLFAVDEPAAPTELQNLEAAFMKTFSDPEEFKASGIFQLLGYNNAEIGQIGKITPKPVSITIEADHAEAIGSYRNLRVLCHKVFYYNMTIERVLFDFPKCSIDLEELQAGRLRFKSGEQISLKTEVSSEDILGVFNLYAKAQSLSHLHMKLEKNCARLNGRVKKGFVTVAFNLNGNTQLVDPKTVIFRCERLNLNGFPMPRNVISTIFKQINPVFDSRQTWFNLNVASISIKPGFVETHATIDPKKG